MCYMCYMCLCVGLFGLFRTIQNMFRKVNGQNNLNMNMWICCQQPWGDNFRIEMEHWYETIHSFKGHKSTIHVEPVPHIHGFRTPSINAQCQPIWNKGMMALENKENNSSVGEWSSTFSYIAGIDIGSWAFFNLSTLGSMPWFLPVSIGIDLY